MQLVGLEPDVVNPIQINFDPQGRLWVLCVPGYPRVCQGDRLGIMSWCSKISAEWAGERSAKSSKA
ncbi:MAG: hypothetical protein U0744_15540 [Gemmataceae bacterium]